MKQIAHENSSRVFNLFILYSFHIVMFVVKSVLCPSWRKNNLKRLQNDLLEKFQFNITSHNKMYLAHIWPTPGTYTRPRCGLQEAVRTRPSTS